MTVQITQFFTDNFFNSGWSETWWSPSTDLSSALTGWAPVITTRLALLEDTCQMSAVRASTPGPPRDSLYLVPSPNVGTIASASHKPVGPWEALLVRRDVSTFDLLGHLFMHGTTVDIFKGRLIDTTAAYWTTWNTNFTAWFNALLAAGAALRKGPKTAYTYHGLSVLTQRYQTEHRVGRPSDPLRGRRLVA